MAVSPKKTVSDPRELQLTAFFAWTASGFAAMRPVPSHAAERQERLSLDLDGGRSAAVPAEDLA